MKKLLLTALTLSMASGLQAISWVRDFKRNPSGTVEYMETNQFTAENNPIPSLARTAKKLEFKKEFPNTNKHAWKLANYSVLAIAQTALAAVMLKCAISDYTNNKGVGLGIYALISFEAARHAGPNIIGTVKEANKTFRYSTQVAQRANAIKKMQAAAAINPSVIALNEAAAKAAAEKPAE